MFAAAIIINVNWLKCKQTWVLKANNLEKLKVSIPAMIYRLFRLSTASLKVKGN
jgi:hypothetical protein